MRVVRWSIAVLVAASAASCARATVERPPAGSAAAQHAEATGRVVEVGADPVTWLALEPVAGGAQTRLGGPATAAMRAVLGAIVWVSGSRSANGFTVDVFEVRRIGDRDVDDGVVIVSEQGVQLRMHSGTLRDIPNATPALRAAAGARVWVSRPVEGVAPSYGVIAHP